MENTKPRRPVLFHDIDGVLFGKYGGAYQLRPQVNDWLQWAHERFEVLWLTSWSAVKTKALLELTYNAPLLTGFQHANWTNFADKVTWLLEATPKLERRDWFWIDDEVPDEPESLRGLSPARCIKVCPTGQDALLDIRMMLANRLMAISLSEGIRTGQPKVLPRLLTNVSREADNLGNPRG